MRIRSRLWISVCISLFATSCAPSAHRGDPATDLSSPPAGAAHAWEISRYAEGRRAIYAAEEIAELADHFVEALPAGFDGRTARLAFSYFVSTEGERVLGEWLLQTLASLLVEKSGGALEVYTRRKLTRVIEEHKLQTRGFRGAEFDESTIVEMGELSGVDAVITGTLDIRKGRQIVLNCQAIEVRTGKILPSKVIRIPLQKVTPRRPVWDEETAERVLAQRVFDDLPAGLSRMAAYPISRGRQEFTTGSSFLDNVVTVASNFDRARLEQITRSKLNAAFREHQISKSEMFSDESKDAVLEFVGANLVLTGYAEKFDGLYEYNVQVIDVKTARILVAERILVNASG